MMGSNEIGIVKVKISKAGQLQSQYGLPATLRLFLAGLKRADQSCGIR